MICGSSMNLFAIDVYDSILIDTDWRTYNIHLPTGYSSSNRYPLILGFHGGQQAGRTDIGWQALPTQSRLTEKADKEGFIIVYPEGKEYSTGRSWNAGNCCPPSASKDVDDIRFIDKLLNTLIDNYSIDSNRIYATGTSNGGMFCYRLACELSHRIAAIAPNAASHMMQPCNPTLPISIISFNSKIDPIVLYKGGNGPAEVPFLKDVYFPSQDSNLSVWKNINQCLKIDTVINGGNKNVDFIKVNDCKCNVEILHYATTDGGHSWPGGVPNNVSLVSTQIDATELLWDFFKQYSLGCKTTGISEHQYSDINTIYPNPAEDIVNIVGIENNFSYTIINLFGERIAKGNSSGSIDISHLPQGVFILIINERDRRIFRFIKK